MRVTILADSNALPRAKEWGHLPLEGTYPYLLAQKLRARFPNSPCHLTERGMRYRTLQTVLEDWYEYVTLRETEYVVVQVGGADCAPRVLLPEERRWVKSWRWRRLSERVLSLEDRYRRGLLLRLPARTMVPLATFRAHLQELVTLAAAPTLRRVFVVNIFEPAQRILHDFVGASELIGAYNAALSDAARESAKIELVPLFSMVKELGGADQNTVDGLHLAPFAQEKLAEHLATRIAAAHHLPDAGLSAPLRSSPDLSPAEV